MYHQANHTKPVKHIRSLCFPKTWRTDVFLSLLYVKIVTQWD